MGEAGVGDRRPRIRVGRDGRVRGVPCPECGKAKVGAVFKGMPDGDLPRGFIVGGCDPMGPSFGCHACGWSGEESDLTPPDPVEVAARRFDFDAIRDLRPFVNAIAGGYPGVSPKPPGFGGEARDHYELACRYGRVRYTVTWMGGVVGWFDDSLGWFVPLPGDREDGPYGQEADAAQALLRGLGSCRVLPTADLPNPWLARDREWVSVMAVYRNVGSERELFSVTAVGDGGVRFWFARLHPGAGFIEWEENWRRTVLDAMRLARKRGLSQDFLALLGDQVRAQPKYGADAEHESDGFDSWEQAEDHASELIGRSRQ